MKPEKFRQLIQTVFAVRDEEILCSAFFELLPRFVDLQSFIGNAADHLPEVGHHFHQCPECDEVYQALLQAVQPEK